MTILDKIETINTEKSNIITEINIKGGDLDNNPPLAELAPAIANIPISGAPKMINTSSGLRLAITTIDLSTEATGGVALAQPFTDCVNLTTITGTDKIVSIRGSVFQGCVSLLHANFPAITGFSYSSVFEGCVSLKTVNCPLAKNLGTNTFKDCSSLEEAIFPVGNNVSGTFEKCSSLTKAVIYNLENISSASFRGCTKLETLVIGLNRVCLLRNVNAFANTNTTWKCYVPDSLVPAYKVADCWVDFASQIYPMSELPE